MRVAYICADPGVPVYGRKGCSIHVQEVIRALQEQGAQVELFACRPEGCPPAGLERVRLHRLHRPVKGEPALREQQALGANNYLNYALENSGPYDLVYERYSLWSYAGMEYAHASGVPGILEVNAPLIEEQAEHRELVDRAGAERVAERVFAAAKLLIAVSEGIAVYLEERLNQREKVHVVTNGVNPDRFPDDLEPSLQGPFGAFTVGFVGTLKPWHGLSQLVEAFALLRKVERRAQLLVIGDGPEREKLIARLSMHGLLEAAQIRGSVDYQEVPGLLASMSVGVAPYPDRSDFYFSPLKVFEYMAAGLPVVASRIGQLANLIRDGENGLLCPPGDSEALAWALFRLARKPSLRARLGGAARATVLADYSWTAVVRRILELAEIDGSPDHCLRRRC